MQARAPGAHPRTALEDVDLGDERFSRGDAFYLCLGAANRDPDAFERPDSLDVRRERPQPLTFGGIHHCLGAAMGRLETRLGLSSLLGETPQLRLAGQPQWRQGAVFRGLTSLPLATGLARPTSRSTAGRPTGAPRMRG